MTIRMFPSWITVAPWESTSMNEPGSFLPLLTIWLAITSISCSDSVTPAPLRCTAPGGPLFVRTSTPVLRCTEDVSGSKNSSIFLGSPLGGSRYMTSMPLISAISLWIWSPVTRVALFDAATDLMISSISPLFPPLLCHSCGLSPVNSR